MTNQVKPIAYEVTLLLKVVPKEELASIVKRCTLGVFRRGGFLRNLYYLGLQNTPYRFSKNATAHWKANYFYYEFHMPKVLVPDLFKEYTRDVDVIHHTFHKVNDETINYARCTFEDEMKPVPYRPQVIKLVETTKKFEEALARRRVKLNMNSDFYPFQK